MNVVKAYCDGGVVLKNPSPIGGSWAFVLVDELDHVLQEESGYLRPGRGDACEVEFITNNFTEMYAAYRALRALPYEWNGTLYSDSRITLGRLFEGFKWKGIPFLLEGDVRLELSHMGRMSHVLLDGHPTKNQLLAGIGKRGQPVSVFNVRCDELCREQNIKCLKAYNQEVMPAKRTVVID